MKNVDLGQAILGLVGLGLSVWVIGFAFKRGASAGGK
jgi:hypothetical protein